MVWIFMPPSYTLSNFLNFEFIEIPDIHDISILDGEEWDLSLAIDQYQNTLNTNKINQANTTTDDDINQTE
jgi:hypothetical protein